MDVLKELIIRSVLVVGLNDAIIFYWLSKHSKKITLLLVTEVILVTCIALAINIWYCLYRRGMI